jgi:hypothetical protein
MGRTDRDPVQKADREKDMEFDAVKPDAPMDHEQLADYWRERAELLEEWVCELLRKNQVLRMGLEEHLPHREETVSGFQP